MEKLYYSAVKDFILHPRKGEDSATRKALLMDMSSSKVMFDMFLPLLADCFIEFGRLAKKKSCNLLSHY